MARGKKKGARSKRPFVQLVISPATGLRPIVAAATTAAGVVPAAAIIDAEIRTAHVAVAGLLPLAGVRRRYHTAALAVAAVQEVMRHFLPGHHTRTHREAAGEPAPNPRN